MAVAPWCRNPEYLAFYRDRVAAGDHVILDNGAYEEELIDNREYKQLIETLRPMEYIAPDVIYDHESTRRKYYEFCTVVFPSEPIFVYHGNRGDDIIPDTMVVALGKWRNEGRIAACEKLRSRTIHCLGFIDKDPLAELTKLQKLGVRSIDSSWAFTGTFLPDAVKMRDSWNTELWPEVVSSFNRNFDRVVELCGAKETKSIVYVPNKKYMHETPFAIDKPGEGARRERKPPYHSVPREFIEYLSGPCAEGLEVYGKDNWRGGGAEFIEDLYNHGLEHAMLWSNGDRSEDHLAKAAWNFLARRYFEEKEKEK